jgi:hypothetical protein
MRLRLLIALAAALWAFAVPVTRVSACTCGYGVQSDLAFTGTAIEWTGVNGKVSDFENAELVYTFDVDGVVKGQVVNRQVKVVARGGLAGSCGVRFDIGQRALVLAYANGRGWKTHSCMGSRQLTAGEVLPVRVSEPAPGDTGIQISRKHLALVGAGLAVMLGLFVAARRAREAAEEMD